MNRMWHFLLIIVGLILLDQLTKGAVQSSFELGESQTIIKGFFNFTRVHNTGAAFGFMARAGDTVRKLLFLLIPIIACFWLMTLIWKSRKEPYLHGLCYSLILAGAIGNLIDRILLGYVVDFFDFYIGNSHYPAFNIADSAITVGACLLVLDHFLRKKPKPEAAA